MYPTRLNIIATAKRKYIDKMVYMQFVRNSVEVFLFLMCASTVFLVGSWWILQSHFNELASKLTIRSDKQTERSLQIREINTLLGDIKLLQVAFLKWTPIIARVTDKLPQGTVLSSMTLDVHNKSYHITGFAESRDILLALEERIRTLPEVVDVNIPISQLIAKDDINFDITIELK